MTFLKLNLKASRIMLAKTKLDFKFNLTCIIIA